MAAAAPNWTRHVKDLGFTDLEQVHEELDALRSHPGWFRLLELIDAEKAMVDGRLDRGDEPLSQAQYALLHGQRAGLAAPVAVINAVAASYAERRDQLERSAGADGR